MHWMGEGQSLGKSVPHAHPEQDHAVGHQDGSLSHPVDELPELRLDEDADRGGDDPEFGDRRSGLVEYLDEHPRSEGHEDLLARSSKHAHGVQEPSSAA